MPFGLKNAPAFFQRIMDLTLRTCRDFAWCYIDDIIVHSQSFEDHLIHLRRTFGQIREKGVKLHPKKMKLAMPSVSYLGHEIVPNGTATDEAKFGAIKLMPLPKDDTELRAFLDSANYYQRFIRDFLRIAAPLNRLLHDDVAWDWDETCQTAFEALKQQLLEAPILQRPNYKRPFELHTDWSSVGLGAVLVQRDDEGRVRCSICIPELQQSRAQLLELSRRVPGHRLGGSAFLGLPVRTQVHPDHGSRAPAVAHAKRTLARHARALGEHPPGV
jgi:hypothetical protein